MMPSLPTTAISADAPSAITYSSETMEPIGNRRAASDRRIHTEPDPAATDPVPDGETSARIRRSEGRLEVGSVWGYELAASRTSSSSIRSQRLRREWARCRVVIKYRPSRRALCKTPNISLSHRTDTTINFILQRNSYMFATEQILGDWVHIFRLVAMHPALARRAATSYASPRLRFTRLSPVFGPGGYLPCPLGRILLPKHTRW